MSLYISRESVTESSMVVTARVLRQAAEGDTYEVSQDFLRGLEVCVFRIVHIFCYAAYSKGYVRSRVGENIRIHWELTGVAVLKVEFVQQIFDVANLGDEDAIHEPSYLCAQAFGACFKS